MRIVAVLLSFYFGITFPIYAEEYFGEFSGDPKGTFSEGEPWQLFTLDESFHFDDPNGLRWEVPKGTSVNGASIPPAFWSVIGGPFTGKYLKASIVHDHYVTTKERTAHDTHRNFYYGMLANGESKWRAQLMYWAVNTFGDDWIVEKQVTLRSECGQNEIGVLVCRDVPIITEVIQDVPGVNLQDPVQLQLARQKFAAIARTLKSSDGEFLDITEAGNIEATDENIVQNSRLTLRTIKSWNEQGSLADLGTLAEWSTVQNGNVPSWSVSGPELPDPSEFRAATADENDAPYVLNGSNADYDLLKFQALELQELLEQR